MKVKICGIKKYRDLKSSEKFNPAFIGFINIERSPRFIDTHKIKELKQSMEDFRKAVLIMEPKNPDEVIKKVEESGIKTVQLHSLFPEEISLINGVNIIKAVGIPPKIDVDKIKEIEQFSSVCNYLLFDSEISGKSGGTGRQIPIEIAAMCAEIAKLSNPNIKLILAGGMNKERIKNEGKVINRIFDYVDVNSGVEDRPGIKNTLKIKEFMEICEVTS